MRAAVAAACRTVISRLAHTAYPSHSTGPSPTRRMDVALTPPTSATATANRAGYRHRPLRAARAVSPIIQPSAAHGMTIAEVRPR